jgi:hypothetical protein
MSGYVYSPREQEPVARGCPKHFLAAAPLRKRMAGVYAALSCASLTGCVDVSMIGTGQPDPTLAKNLLVDADVLKEDPAKSGQFVDQSGQCTKDPQDCYWKTKSLIDYRYQVYKTNLLHAVNTGSFAGDFISLGLNVAGTITPGATAAKLFNALAGAATGTKSLVSQDILYKQTITILMSEMDSDRADEASKIEKGLSKDTPVPEVIDELLVYYEAGTFQHALVTLESKAGSPKTASSPPTTDVQTLVTIQPAPGKAGAKFPKGATFELDGTVGSYDIKAAYTLNTAETPAEVAANLADRKEFVAGAVAAKSEGPTITLSYKTASAVNWVPAGTEAKYITITPQKADAAPADPGVAAPAKPAALPADVAK